MKMSDLNELTLKMRARLSKMIMKEVPDNKKQYIRRVVLMIISKTHLGMRSIVIDRPYNLQSSDDIKNITTEIMKYVKIFDDDKLSYFMDDVILELRTTNEYRGLGCLYMDATSGNEIEIASFLAKTC